MIAFISFITTLLINISAFLAIIGVPAGIVLWILCYFAVDHHMKKELNKWALITFCGPIGLILITYIVWWIFHAIL